MTQITMTVTGIEEVKAKLDELAYAAWLKGLLQAAASDIEGLAKKYPNATSANAPPYPYYKRGYGTMYAKNRGRKTSETMNRKWHTSSANFSASVYNVASYSEYVIGERQAWFHKARGWKLLTTAAQQEVPKILQAISAKIVSLWNK